MVMKLICMCCAVIFLCAGSASAQSCDARDRFERNYVNFPSFNGAFQEVFDFGTPYPETCEEFQQALDSTYSVLFRNNCSDTAGSYAFSNNDDPIAAMDEATAHCEKLAETVDEAAYRKVVKCSGAIRAERQRVEDKRDSGEELTPEEDAFLGGEVDLHLINRDCFYNVHKS